MLKAYMHGYFVDNKLYQRAKSVANPSLYEDYKKEKARKKEKERKEKRITLNTKKPKVNAELAERWERDGKVENENENEEQKTEEMDDRFSQLFKNEDFAIDQNSEDFRRAYASGLGKKAGDSAQIDSEESEEVFQEDFDLLKSEEEKGPYVGRSGKKERAEKERIKPKKNVRFYGVKEDSKVTIPTTKGEMKKEVEKRREKRMLSLGQRAKALEKGKK